MDIFAYFSHFTWLANFSLDTPRDESRVARVRNAHRINFHNTLDLYKVASKLSEISKFGPNKPYLHEKFTLQIIFCSKNEEGLILMLIKNLSSLKVISTGL